jgi:hypothetical protein
MPSVSELLTQIKDMALVGAGDASDDARVLRYLNMIYKDVYRKTAKMAPTLLLAQDTVAISSGAGTMSVRPYSVEVVKDANNANRKLEATDLPTLEDKHPALDGTGAPSYYYFTSPTGIATYPVNTTSIKVRYVPAAGTLTADSVEADIKVPPEFHDMFVWGTLMYLNFDERDRAMGAEQATAGTMYSVALGDYQEWLLTGQPRKQVRTKVNPLG